MDQLDNSDRNRHGQNTNINHFEPLFESEDEEGTKPKTNPKKTLVIVLRDDEYKGKNKG